MKCTKEKREAILKMVSLVLDIEGNEDEDWAFHYSGKANTFRAETERSDRADVWLRLNDERAVQESIEDLYELALRSAIKGEENEQV